MGHLPVTDVLRSFIRRGAASVWNSVLTCAADILNNFLLFKCSLIVWEQKQMCTFYCGQKNIYVADLTEEVVTSPAQALAWVRKGESKI